MLYILICFDKADQFELRERTRAEHRTYVKSNIERGAVPHLIQAGPLCMGDQDDRNLGSFMIFEADNIEEIKRFHDGDPFVKAGLFDRVYIHRWDRHVG